jgi:hypothetical protein
MREQVEVIKSDLSGLEIDPDNAVRIVVSDHPILGSRTVELDAALSEIDQLESNRLNMVSVAVHVPGEAVRRIILDAAAFDKLFKGDVAEILLGARNGGAAPAPARRTRRTKRAPAARGERTDYTAIEHFGQLHRGRVTDEEAALVRNNLEQANQNRDAAGQPPIDVNDPREAKRYRL